MTGETEAGRGHGVPAGERTGDWLVDMQGVPVSALLVAGPVLGFAGDLLLRAAGPPGLNMSLWVAVIALAALALSRHAGSGVAGGRGAWLVVTVLFGAALAWRDAPPLRLLALGAISLGFAMAAYRRRADWVRRAGVTRYVGAWATGAVHAWTAAALVLLQAIRSRRRADARDGTGRAAAVARGLAIATPLVLVFGALFASADAVFEGLVLRLLRIDLDIETLFSHVVLFVVCTWLSTGYLCGFLRGTELTPLRGLWRDGARPGGVPSRPTLGITEVATALAVLDVLFLLFVIVQFRYLFGGDTLVQVTPELTYAEYARRGFFELVFAVVLIVPVLLAADWLLARRAPGDERVFRVLAGAQVGLMLAITVSALQRLRLYHASYGFTESRFYALVLLVWIGVMLAWLAATVLRGRRERFAFGALVSGLATIGLLFVLNPDATIARTNAARMASADRSVEAAVRFDVAYATSLSADAVPVLIDALPTLPVEVQCPLARHLLRRWSPENVRALRAWNWSGAHANEVVRRNGTRLRAMVGTDPECAVPQGAASVLDREAPPQS